MSIFKGNASMWHAVLAVPCFGIGWVAAGTTRSLGAWVCVVMWFASRELAQSFRASDPTKLVWSASNTRNLVQPVAVATVLAVVSYALGLG